MAYQYSKGWFIQQLKQKGIFRHPIERKKLKGPYFFLPYFCWFHMRPGNAGIGKIIT